ncbi:hypothetical protein GEMRC1_000601 [Eukaryota sp. GEM-RC1]
MTFETAIVKVLKGHEVELNTAEKNTLVKFEKAPSDIALESVDIQSDLNNSALRRQNASRYIDLSFIPGTSNECERLFSASVPPTARTKIELALTQDEEVGDGTTSVMILAFELLAYAKPLFNSYLTIIVEDYDKLVSIAFAVLTYMKQQDGGFEPCQVYSW